MGDKYVPSFGGLNARLVQYVQRAIILFLLVHLLQIPDVQHALAERMNMKLSHAMVQLPSKDVPNALILPLKEMASGMNGIKRLVIYILMPQENSVQGAPSRADQVHTTLLLTL